MAVRLYEIIWYKETAHSVARVKEEELECLSTIYGVMLDMLWNRSMLHITVACVCHKLICYHASNKAL